MCSRRRRRAAPAAVVAAAALALGVTAGRAPAGAQETPSPADDGFEALVEEVARLAARHRAAADEADRADWERRSLEGAEAPGGALDTLAVGPLRVLTSPEEAADARRLWARVWEEYAFLEGRRVTPGEHVFTFRTDPSRVAGSAPRRHVNAPRWAGEDAVLDRIRSAVGWAVRHDLPDPVGGWMAGADLRPPPSWRDVYRALVVTPWNASRACLDGDDGACEVAVGAVPLTPERTERWFPPESLRRWVSGLEASPVVVARVRRACEDGDDEACRRFVAEVHGNPVPVSVRASLVWTALEMGGEGAADRLARASDALGDWSDWSLRGDLDEAWERGEWRYLDLLAEAAGVPPGDLLDEWRSRLLAARPDPREGLERTRLSSVLWILAISAFALRSTRWRLG